MFSALFVQPVVSSLLLSSISLSFFPLVLSWMLIVLFTLAKDSDCGLAVSMFEGLACVQWIIRRDVVSEEVIVDVRKVVGRI